MVGKSVGKSVGGRAGVQARTLVYAFRNQYMMKAQVTATSANLYILGLLPRKITGARYAAPVGTPYEATLPPPMHRYEI